MKRRIEKQTNASCQNDIDLAREQDKNKELHEELKQLRVQNQEHSSSIRLLEDSNEALLIQLEVKDSSIVTLQAEIDTLRKDNVIREEELLALTNGREKSLADARINCDQLQSEKESLELSFCRAEGQVRVSKENEAFAKERLLQLERECVDKLAAMDKREKDAILAATSNLEKRLQLAEVRARIAEKNEEVANACRRDAEEKVAKVRIEAEESLCKAREQMKCDYELLLQSKDDEKAALMKSREADRLQMDDMRNKHLDQAKNHQVELEGHTKKLEEKSCFLHHANSDLKQEKERATKLNVDLASTHAKLEAAKRQREEDEQAWNRDKDLLENEINLLKEDVHLERSNRKNEAADYRSQQEKALIREQELQSQVQEMLDTRKSELVRMEARATSAIKAIFDESRCT